MLGFIAGFCCAVIAIYAAVLILAVLKPTQTPPPRLPFSGKSRVLDSSYYLGDDPED